MRLPVLLAFAAALCATGPVAAAPRGDADLARAVGTRRAGSPISCLSPLDQTSVQVIDGTAIVYGHGTRLYVNRPVDGAEALRWNDVLVAQVDRQQLCRLDTVTLFAPASHVPRGVVRLGSFVPYSRAGSGLPDAGGRQPSRRRAPSPDPLVGGGGVR